MGAYPEVGQVGPASVGGFAMASGRPVRGIGRRAVAITPDSVELLRPSSDLARLLASFHRADVLLAAEDVPAAVDHDDLDDGIHDRAVDDEVRERAAALGHPDLVVHRLALQTPIAASAEVDLVAALSELIGFDPEHGVYCLAPATPPDTAIERATQRVAQVYGLPLLRYRCLELSVVEPLGREVADPALGA